MAVDLSVLNPEQLEAVKASHGPTLIIAGPGTGKTAALAYRIAHLVEHHASRCPPILAITFTNKAAQEMRNRVSTLLRDEVFPSSLWIGTFHSLGLSILREEGYRIGLAGDFQVLAESEKGELIKDVLSAVMPQEPLNQSRTWVRRISEYKNGSLDVPPRLPLASDIPKSLFSAYEGRLQELNLLDFDDLILKPLALLREHPQVREKYQDRFGHILVDEFQDINNVQYQFLKEIRGPQALLWVIGDADQAIYGFRGAKVEYFMRFREEQRGTKTIALEKNYRSSKNILAGAQAVISHNPHRIPHNLISSKQEGPPICVHEASDHRGEARFVVKEVERLVGGVRMDSTFEGHEMFGFGEMAILYRLHALSHPFSQGLQESGIPFQVVGGPAGDADFPLRDVIPYLRLVLNPHDDLSFRTILPRIHQKFDVKATNALMRLARGARCSLYSVLPTPETVQLVNNDMAVSLRRFFLALQHFQEQSRHQNLKELVRSMVKELKEAGLMEEGSDFDWFPLVEPWAGEEAYGQIPQFLESMALLKEGETYNPTSEKVTLMTVHAAKGLEFPVVFMVGLESGIFPCTEFGEEAADLEEERRLFYVGMTRAKERLYLCHANERYLFGENRRNTPSPFILEVPRELTDNVSGVRENSKLSKKQKARQLTLFS